MAIALTLTRFLPRAAFRSLWLATALLAACSEPPPPSQAGQAVVTASLPTATVVLEKFAHEIAFDGVVEAINQSTVAAQTSGRVVELPYDVGDYVEQDAMIVRFTTTEQRARTGGAEAALAEAEARLAEAQLGYDRAKDVYEKKVIAKAQFDKAVADLDSARARAKVARAALDEAREGLGYTTIRAPFAGIVVARHVQIGETVSPGVPLMTGVSLDQLRIAVNIPQQHIGPLRKHQTARAILPDGRSVPVTDLRMPPAADPATHSFRVLVSLPPIDGDAGVFPGTLVKVAFVSGESEGLLLPPQALVRRGEVTACYIVDNQGVDEQERVSFRALRVGSPGASGSVPVLAGLAVGEKVALDSVAAAAAYRQQRGSE